MTPIVRRLLCVAMILIAPWVSAAPPQTINYQGYLTSSGGVPVNSAVVMTFRLYNAASGGAAIYSETQLAVGVSNGSFSAVIGSVVPLSLPFDVPYWLTVAINADAEMSPRQPLSSSPYAFRASSLDSSATVDGAQVTGTVASAGSANVATMAMLAGGLQGTLPASQVSGALTGATLAATQLTGMLGSGQLAATQRLPTTACAANEIAQWNGSAWACGTGAIGPAGPAGPPGPNEVAGNLTLLNSTPSAGNVYKEGALFLHNAGFDSVFLGSGAGNLTFTGGSNTGVGVSALGLLAEGPLNAALGTAALYRNSTGGFNTGIGAAALVQNTQGSSNTAVGYNTLSASVSSSNNIAIGSGAGSNIGGGGDNILIGNPGDPMDANTLRLGLAPNLTRTFIAGIRGVSPALGNTLPVVIDSNGQLGTGAVAASGVTSVATGAGLTGGPITSSGIIGLANTQLLPVAACANNDVVKWNGSAWVCAADNDTATVAVTSVATGAGLTGGPITSSGTIGLANTQLLPTVACGNNQVVKWNGSAWACGADNDTNSGGTVTSITAGGGLTGGTITGAGTLAVDPTSTVLTNNYFKLGGNSFGASAVLGSTDNVPVEIIANGIRSARFEPTPCGVFCVNVALGSPLNVAGGTGANGLGVNGATVGGGGRSGFPNLATENYATVAGGVNNKAQAESGTVGGGFSNTASGDYSTVPGGYQNKASGISSFAAGRNANTQTFNGVVTHGAFVWADGSGANFFATADNEFSVRATGGVRFVTEIGNVGAFVGVPTRLLRLNPSAELEFGSTTRQMLKLYGTGNYGVGVQNGTLYQRTDNHFAWYVGGTHSDAMLTPGGTGVALMTLTDGAATALPVSGVARAQSFVSTSDRASKAAFASVDGIRVLAALAKMPVQSWQYRNEGEAVRHIGPTAQDFRAAFGVGYDDKSIAMVDAAGVALAAIQGLNQLVAGKDALIDAQGKRIQALEDALAAIQSRLGLK